jgi:hypothetical protein
MPDLERLSAPGNTPAPISTLSLTSLMMGIIGWIFLPVVGGIIAIITGHLAKREIRQSEGLLGGNSLATAGLLLGYANLAAGLCACLFLFTGLGALLKLIIDATP